MKQWLAATVVMLAGCSGTGPGEADLAGTRWALAELNGQAVTPVGEGNAGHLNFEAAQHRFAASAGCNGMSGQWSSDGSALSFSGVVSTLMACEEPLMSREQMLSEALTATTAYRVTDQRLELLAGENVLAAFTEAAAQ